LCASRSAAGSLFDDGLEAGVEAGMVVVAVLEDSKDSVEESN